MIFTTTLNRGAGKMKLRLDSGKYANILLTDRQTDRQTDSG